MELIRSCWKLTFDPAAAAVVLLDFGDWIDAELDYQLKKSLQVTPLDEGTAPFLRAAGNAQYSFTFKVYKEETLDATARRRVMESLMSVAPLVKKPLRIGVDGITNVTGTYWQFANSYITDHAPSRVLLTRVPYHMKQYGVTATTLTQTGA